MGVASTGLVGVLAGCAAPAQSQPTTAPASAPAPAQPTTAPAAVVAPSQGQPAAAAPTAAPGNAFQTEWDALVAAAKKEGKVVVQTPVGAGYRVALQAFSAAYPGIEPEQQAFPDSATFVPKISGERKAGIFNFDVAATTSTPMVQVFKPGGFIEPLKPVLMRPDVLDDGAWAQGFSSRWVDLTKSHVFRHQAGIVRSVYLNTDLVKEGEITTLDDLLDPKWKGKIVTSDVAQGYVYTVSTVIREQKGEDWLKRLFVDQQPQMIRDRRQAVELLVRGGAPIGFGLNTIIMGDFINQGLANNIKIPDIPGAGYGSGDIVALFNKAPHPNAAKLFINWLLSKEGQVAWSTGTRINSARLDVPVVDPLTAPGKVAYEVPTQEEWLPKTAATQEFLKKLVS